MKPTTLMLILLLPLGLAAGCGLHTALDVLTHVDDGPVLGFPFDWQRRWAGPVSYWDEKHRGREFRRFEHLLDMVLVLLSWRNRNLRS